MVHRLVMVDDSRELRAMVRSILRPHPTIEVVGDTDEATFEDLFHLNVRGYFFCAKAAVERMCQAGGGSIVNLTSVHAHAALPGGHAHKSPSCVAGRAPPGVRRTRWQ